MPQLRCYGLTEEDVRAMSEEIVEELAVTMVTPQDYFIFTHVPYRHFLHGKDLTLDPPMVEVLQFASDHAQEKQVAKIILSFLGKRGYPHGETYLKEEDYYEKYETDIYCVGEDLPE